MLRLMKYGVMLAHPNIGYWGLTEKTMKSLNSKKYDRRLKGNIVRYQLWFYPCVSGPNRAGSGGFAGVRSSACNLFRGRALINEPARGRINGMILLAFAFLAVLSSCVKAPSQDPPSSPPTAQLPTPAGLTYQAEYFDVRIRELDRMEMVFVPAGQFEMGNDSDQRARPVHTISIDDFWIDQTEVTNAMFSAFLNERGNQAENGVNWLEPGAGSRGVIYGYISEDGGSYSPRSGYENYPVVEVSWYGAAAYCDWVGGRLPTEAEWEYAARGPRSLIYPWGNIYDGSHANYCDFHCAYEWRDIGSNDRYAEWAPVGSFPGGASWCGALDMAGNIWEWVNDWWAEDYYARSPEDNPPGPETGALHVARGASWYDLGRENGVTSRAVLTASSYRMHWVGIRCVMPATP